MKSKIWLYIHLTLVIVLLILIAALTIFIDPYMHYHSPLTDTFFYTLDNQRSMNNGISRNFDYDAIITGTSMTENFKSSELDSLFGTNSIKVCFSGASFHEINNNLTVALRNNPDLKMIVRCLDYAMLINESDLLRTDLGSYPDYLYDDNIFNDVEYLFNRDILIKEDYVMLEERAAGIAPGITSFDDYSRWSDDHNYGVNIVYPDSNVDFTAKGAPVHLTDYERQITLENIQLNVTALAQQYPHVDFYYYMSPYSVAWWHERVADGEIYKYLEAIRIAFEEILKYDNIKLFTFSHLPDITEDLNNYKDSTHHGGWINSLILKMMHDDRGRLDLGNYEEHLSFLEERYLSFDYSSLLSQEDYEDDLFILSILQEKFGYCF